MCCEFVMHIHYCAVYRVICFAMTLCLLAVYPQDSSASPFGIALSGDQVYWTDLASRSVLQAHKIDGSEQRVILDELEDVSGITLISHVDKDRKG